MKLPGVGPHSAWCQWRGRRSLPSTPLSGAVLRARAALLNVVSVSAWHRSSASLPGSLTGSQLKLPCLAPTSLA